MALFSASAAVEPLLPICVLSKKMALGFAMFNERQLTMCPEKETEVIPDEAMLRLSKPTMISCPACDGVHIWDPANRTLMANKNRSGDATSQEAKD